MQDLQDELRRLKTAEGHLRGIQRMVEEGAFCIDIIRQVQPVQSVLSRVNTEILVCHIPAVRGDDPAERERVLHEISATFQAANKA